MCPEVSAATVALQVARQHKKVPYLRPMLPEVAAASVALQVTKDDCPYAHGQLNLHPLAFVIQHLKQHLHKHHTRITWALKMQA
jgi:hypothetical protein